MVVKPFPHIGDNSQADKIHQIGLAIIEDSFDKEKEDDGNRKEKKHFLILFHEDIIQGGLNQVGLARSEKRDKGHADHGKNDLGPIGFNQFEKSAIKGHRDSLSNPECRMEK